TGVNDTGGAMSPPRGRRARSSPASARTSSRRSSGRSCRSHRSRVSRNCCCSARDSLFTSASTCSRLLVPISHSLSCPVSGALLPPSTRGAAVLCGQRPPATSMHRSCATIWGVHDLACVYLGHFSLGKHTWEPLGVQQAPPPGDEAVRLPLDS